MVLVVVVVFTVIGLVFLGFLSWIASLLLARSADIVEETP